MHTNLCTEVAYKPISAETPSFWIFGYQVCATRTSHALPLPLLLIFPRRGNETRSHPPQGDGKSDFPNASETLERLPKTYRAVVVGRIWGTLSATVARDWGQLGSHRTPQYAQAPWTIDGREEPELEQPELPMLTRFTETGQGRRGLPPRGRSP